MLGGEWSCFVCVDCFCLKGGGQGGNCGRVAEAAGVWCDQKLPAELSATSLLEMPDNDLALFIGVSKCGVPVGF